jgi:hypothetical protein
LRWTSDSGRDDIYLVVREVLIFRPIEGRPLLSEPRGI